MAANRMAQLRKLSQSLPGADQRIAQGLQAGRETQLQEAVKQAQPGAGVQQAQQSGAMQAQQAGQQQLQQAQQAQQQQAQVGKMGISERGLQAQQKAGQEARGLDAKQRELATRLGKLSNDKKNELLDKQLVFEKDEANRTLFNERQLMDFALLKSRNEEEYMNYAQTAQQMHQRKIQVLEKASKELEQALKSGYISEKQKLDYESRRHMIVAKRKLDKRLQKARSEGMIKQSQWVAGGTVVGAVVGAVFGGGVGAGAGAAIGGAAGGAIGSSGMV